MFPCEHLKSSTTFITWGMSSETENFIKEASAFYDREIDRYEDD